MTLKTGQKIIKIPLLPNISRSIGNQVLKFGHLIKCNVRNIFLQKSCRKSGWRLVPDIFVILKSFIQGKIKWSALSFNVFCGRPQLGVR